MLTLTWGPSGGLQAGALARVHTVGRSALPLAWSSSLVENDRVSGQCSLLLNKPRCSKLLNVVQGASGKGCCTPQAPTPHTEKSPLEDSKLAASSGGVMNSDLLSWSWVEATGCWLLHLPGHTTLAAPNCGLAHQPSQRGQGRDMMTDLGLRRWQCACQHVPLLTCETGSRCQGRATRQSWGPPRGTRKEGVKKMVHVVNMPIILFPCHFVEARAGPGRSRQPGAQAGGLHVCFSCVGVSVFMLVRLSIKNIC